MLILTLTNLKKISKITFMDKILEITYTPEDLSTKNSQMLKVRAHTCYLGTTGFAAHARSFFRELSKHVDLRVRNYTWDSNPVYLNETDFKIIDSITLRNKEGNYETSPITHSFPQFNWNNTNKYFVQDVDIVLMDINHHYFYDDYKAKTKIAYTVWESTELPQNFFEQLLKFDYLWVVTEWHKQIAIKQGYPEYKIFVVNEGVNEEFFVNESIIPEEENDGRFKFMFFGRWDYRKSVPEIVDSFLKAFPNNEKVDLIFSADNPYSVDSMNNTEERLNHYGFKDERIKVKHFLSREDYSSYIKNGNVLITCARSEGWNIPLIEAMAAGTPVIYSDWGAQLEFAKGKGNPVKIKSQLPASIGSDLGFAGNTPGLYAEPNFNNLVEVLKDCFKYYKDKKRIALEEAKDIKKNYNWETIGLRGYNVLLKVTGFNKDLERKKESVVILSHADTEEKLSILKRSAMTLKSQGYFLIASSHIAIPQDILNIFDYFICETDNPIINDDEYSSLSNTVPIHYLKYYDFDLSYAFDYNHGYAALRLIINGARLSKSCGFSKTHFINYDYVIDDESTLIHHSKLLEEYEVVTYKWNHSESINSAFFSAINNTVIKSLESVLSKKDYFKYEGIVILEDFMYKVFEEFNVKIWKGEINDVSKNNLLNSVTLHTYPQIDSKNGGKSYLYLGYNPDDNKNYICVIGNEEPLEGNILIRDKIHEFSVGAYPMEFYQLCEQDLENDIIVTLPKYNKKFIYNKNTKKASIIIKNKSLIKEIKSEMIKPEININFIDGPFIELKNVGDKRFEVEFIDSKNNQIYYSSEIGNNNWAKCSIEYYKDWIIKVKDKKTLEVFEYKIDLKDKNVLISIESSSLGDSISWFPHVEEFRKKHNCKVFISTFNNDLFKDNYSEITFIQPGEKVNNLYALYRIGWFYDGDNFNKNRHPRDFKNLPMQTTTTDILGLVHKPLKPKLVIKDSTSPIDSDYVCIGIHSTAQAKYWNNPNGWQELVNWFKENGYKVVSLSLEGNGYMGNYYPEGVIEPKGERTLENTIKYLKHSKMFIGLGSGLSWLSWAVGKPTVIISGFSNPTTEVLDDNIIRIFNSNGCNSCFNRHKLNPSDWNWCPDNKGTNRQFECTKNITSDYVIEKIKDYINKGYSEKTVEDIIQESYNLGMVQNHKEILGATEFFKELNVVNFMEIGTDQGGTFAIWSKLSKDGKRISVDIPHGQFGRSDYDEYERDNYLKSLGSDVTMICGSSHDNKILENVKKALGENLLDFLFIDGDHTYEGVKQDYEMYKHLVKPGGWIGFHDIKDTEFHRNANCRVDILWNELEGNKIEFIDNSSYYGGIGFIQK